MSRNNTKSVDHEEMFAQWYILQTAVDEQLASAVTKQERNALLSVVIIVSQAIYDIKLLLKELEGE